MKIFSKCQLDSWQIRQKAQGFSPQVWNPCCSLIRKNYGVIILTCKSAHNCKYQGVRSGFVFCSQQFFHVMKESRVDCVHWFWLVLGGFLSSWWCDFFSSIFILALYLISPTFGEVTPRSLCRSIVHSNDLSISKPSV